MTTYVKDDPQDDADDESEIDVAAVLATQLAAARTRVEAVLAGAAKQPQLLFTPQMVKDVVRIGEQEPLTLAGIWAQLGAGRIHYSALKQQVDAQRKAPQTTRPQEDGPQPPPDRDPDGRLHIPTNLQTRDVAGLAAQALAEANAQAAHDFVFGSGLAYVRVTAGTPAVQPYTVSALRARLAEAATWLRPAGKNWQDARVPPDVAEHLLTIPPALPALVAVTTTPIVRPDGSIRSRDGYDPASGYYLALAPDLAGLRIPRTPTTADVEEACSWWRTLLAGFPFVEPADRAAAWAAGFSLVLRGAIPGPVPLIVTVKASPGTGASLLTDCLIRVALGHALPAKTLPESEEECRKFITSALRKGDRAVCFDNCDRQVHSDVLASVLTATVWQDRLLGVNENVTLPQQAVFFVNGNAVTLADDLARRSVTCRLDTGLPDPFRDRSFAISLPDWADEHRRDLVRAVLVLFRAWQCAGRPLFSGVRLGSFSRWFDTIGGLLDYAGVTGLNANWEGASAALNHRSSEWQPFLGALARVFPATDFRTAQVVDLINGGTAEGRQLWDALPDSLSDRLDSLRVRLGRRLEREAGRPYRVADRVLQLERHGTDRNHVALWRAVARADGPTSGADTTKPAGGAGDARGVDDATPRGPDAQKPAESRVDSAPEEPDAGGAGGDIPVLTHVKNKTHTPCVCDEDDVPGAKVPRDPPHPPHPPRTSSGRTYSYDFTNAPVPDGPILPAPTARTPRRVFRSPAAGSGSAAPEIDATRCAVPQCTGAPAHHDVTGAVWCEAHRVRRDLLHAAWAHRWERLDFSADRYTAGVFRWQRWVRTADDHGVAWALQQLAPPGSDRAAFIEATNAAVDRGEPPPDLPMPST